ncbi:MAG TPA: thioredoxin family protein [Candidatus Deferrimicrobium sp.]|nr:thioredoxin family protein [Candidatus Deferrimicrobium sp.]
MLKRELERLKDPIELVIFLDPQKDPDSFSVYEYLNVIATNYPKLHLKLITKNVYPDLFEQNQIKEVPTLLIEGSGIQYTGIPAGPEAMVFIQTLVMKSTANSGIGEVISRILASLTKNIRIRTIVTTQCTICPLAVKIGNMLSIESTLNGNGKVAHEIINASEHETYVSNYDLSAVPLIIINDEVAFNGIPDVDQYVRKITELGK